jgi:hypothetical protein
LGTVILARVGCAPNAIGRDQLANELDFRTARGPAAERRQASLDNEIASLCSSGLIAITDDRVKATTRGIGRAVKLLAIKGAFPPAWPEMRDVRLVAKALGLEREPAKQLKALTRPDGLRAAVVQRAYKLKVKGIATPSKLRVALATLALERAFGNQIKAGLTGKTGLSAKAGRLLAAQLAKRPRDFGTDARLIAALAAEHLGVRRTDAASLRAAVLARFVAGAQTQPRKREAVPHGPSPSLPHSLPVTSPTITMPVGRPDLAGFAHEVRQHASAAAHGWSGDRRAYISHVWRSLSSKRPDWGLSEIEFKCMLVEAHRAGEVMLANADLKDNNNIKDLQDSAVVYKNSVFHFVRAYA